MKGVRGFALLAAVIGGTAHGQGSAGLDPLQEAVVQSLAFPRRTTPSELFEAVVRATDVEAYEAAADYLGQLVAALDAAGDARAEQLADLGEAVDVGTLLSLERRLAPHAAGVGQVVAAITTARNVRLADPRRLAAAADDLRAADPARRTAAVRRLSAAGIDALPPLVELLRDPAAAAAHPIARRLVRSLGEAAREPLLAWLGSPDVEHWDGVISALVAAEASDVADYLLAPALVADSPPPVRESAGRGLLALGGETSLPRPQRAIERLARRLDPVLSPAGLSVIDPLLFPPLQSAVAAATARDGTLDGEVERWVWDAEAGRVVRARVSPRIARAIAAEHLARDLMALGPVDPDVVSLVLLARLEGALAIAAATGRPRAEPATLREILAGPDGFSAAEAAPLVDMALERGLPEAAAAVAAALEPTDAAAAPLAPAERRALGRALVYPDSGVAFAAARTLARAAGAEPFPGSSQVVATLVHAASSRGEDLVVVAHPVRAIAEEIATGISRFGYATAVVRTGREAVFAARSSPDTVLVILAGTSVVPTALETAQHLRRTPHGSPPPVLVLVDPVIEEPVCPKPCPLPLVAALEGVAVSERLAGLFEPLAGGGPDTDPVAPRFPDLLGQLAGPAAVDPAARARARAARLERAREALLLLAELGGRGHDVGAALEPALRGLLGRELAGPAAAVLGRIGHPAAQSALFDEATRAGPEAGAAAALLRGHVGRHGVLLGAAAIDEAVARYTLGIEAADRSAAGAALEAIGVSGRKLASLAADAAPLRPTR